VQALSTGTAHYAKVVQTNTREHTPCVWTTGLVSVTIEPKRFTDLTPQQQASQVRAVRQESQRWQYASESEWQRMVTEIAHTCGWSVFHWQDSRRTTPGWPDLALIQAPQFMLVELKTDEGRLSRHQKNVLSALHECGLEVHVWRPSDERDVRARLLRK
jgi:hypothetical protein